MKEDVKKLNMKFDLCDNTLDALKTFSQGKILYSTEEDGGP